MCTHGAANIEPRYSQIGSIDFLSFSFLRKDTWRVSSYISNVEISSLYVHHFLEQIGQVIRVISTVSVLFSAVVMAAGTLKCITFSL